MLVNNTEACANSLVWPRERLRTNNSFWNFQSTQNELFVVWIKKAVLFFVYQALALVREGLCHGGNARVSTITCASALLPSVAVRPPERIMPTALRQSGTVFLLNNISRSLSAPRDHGCSRPGRKKPMCVLVFFSGSVHSS
jgi:hypothetical protein